MYDHDLIAVQAVPDQNRLYARDNKGRLVAWDVIDRQFIGGFLVTQISNPQINALKGTRKWPAVLNRNRVDLKLTANGQLRAVDYMGVVIFFFLSLWNLDNGRLISSVNMETVAYPDDPEKLLQQRNIEAVNRFEFSSTDSRSG